MYSLLARYYDQIHAQLQDDLDFILHLARQFGGPVLEMGCGTGRVLLPLLREGFEVTGLDNEEAMLERAERRLRQEADAVRRRARLVRADLRQLILPEDQQKAGLALFTYNTALHFPQRELQSILRRVKPYIHRNGRLLLDLANPFAIESADFEVYPVVENSFRDALTGRLVVQKSRSRLDSSEQCLHTTWILEVEGENSNRVERQEVDIVYWYLYPHQLQLILQRSGFRIDQMLGGYDRAPFSEESERLLLIAVPVD